MTVLSHAAPEAEKEKVREQEPAASNQERIGLLTAGVGLMVLSAMCRRGWLAKTLFAASGGALMYGAQSGVISPGRALGATTRYLTGLMSQALEPITLQATTHVDLPPDAVYRHWRDFRNLPDFLTHIKTVRVHSRLYSHWVIRGMSGMDIGWDTLVTDDRPGRMIGFRSLEGSDMEVRGWVELAPEGQGTALRLTLRYQPAETVAAGALAAHFGPGDPKRLERELARYRRLAEKQALPSMAIRYAKTPQLKQKYAALAGGRSRSVHG